MLAITLFDLRFRSRQFLIAVIGTALVFAIGLLNSGLANSFQVEITRFTASFHADRWFVPAGSSGPMTSFAAMSASDLQEVRSLDGISHADPLIVVPYETVHVGSRALTGSLIGFVKGGIGDQAPSKGADATAPGEAVVDARLNLKIGTTFTMSGQQFHVVGVSHGRTINGGVPLVSMLLADAQRVVFGGQPAMNVIVTQGVPANVPANLHALTTAQVQSDTLRPLRTPISSLQKSMEMMWVIAAVIISALLYVSALERMRDFAVLKALGSSSRALFGGLVLQSVIVTLVGALLADATANLLKPVFPLPVAIPSWAFISLPAVAIGVGVLSSLVALRRAVSVDPSLAFSG
jgi:putative ABC transport system permease protein